MTLSQQEFDAILADDTKRVIGDIEWQDDEDHSPAREFRAEVSSEAGYPLFVNGRCNPKAGTLSYTLVHRRVGRIYGLDLGAEHHNPDCNLVGEKHKHRWTEACRDKQAYVPGDITASWIQPGDVWDQFCAESGIVHEGSMGALNAQKELAL